VTARPRLAIGLPVYNGENYLVDALKSIVDQTYADFELFISDNGSTDSTSEICRELADRDPRVRYVRHDVNRGAAWNYEHAREVAAGTELFKWAAHDDVMAPTFIERCVEALDHHPEAVLAFSGVAAIGPDGVVTRIKHRMVHPSGPTPAKRFRQVVIARANCTAVFGVMRRDALDRTRGHGAYVGADHVLLAELALQGYFHEVPEVLFFNREHPLKSTMAVLDSRKRTAWFTGDTRAQMMPFWRLWREYLNAARLASLDEQERRAAYLQLPWYLPRFGGRLVGDLGFAARQLVASRRDPS
jgi:glycosyltransferase involved in cell wall biosynthesis